MEKRDVWKAKDVLKDMTWPERIDYIWTYYRIHIIIGSACVLFLVAFLSTVLAPNKEVLFGGVTVNVTLSEEGERYLTDKLFAPMGGTDAEKQSVEFTARWLGDQGDSEGYTSEVMAMVAQVAAQMVDYAIMDKAALDQYAPGGMFVDLKEVLTREQIAAFSDKLITITTEEGAVIPAAIDITDIPFIQDCAAGEEAVYIAFPGNTERSEKTDAFFDWLLDWEKD